MLPLSLIPVEQSVHVRRAAIFLIVIVIARSHHNDVVINDDGVSKLIAQGAVRSNKLGLPQPRISQIIYGKYVRRSAIFELDQFSIGPLAIVSPCTDNKGILVNYV